MSFFTPPAKPDVQDVAETLTLAAMQGLMERGATSGNRISLEEAFRSSQRFRDDFARSAKGLVVEHEALEGASNPQRLRAATLMSAAIVAGLVARRESIDKATIQSARLREKLLPIAASIAHEVNPEVTSAIFSGALQGEIAAGADPLTALAKLQVKRRAFAAAAGGLVDINDTQFGEEGQAQRLGAVSNLFATAVAGLVSRGDNVEDALMHVRGRRGSLFAQTTDSVPGQDASAVQEPTSPPPDSWRESRQPASGAELSLEPIKPKAP